MTKNMKCIKGTVKIIIIINEPSKGMVNYRN